MFIAAGCSESTDEGRNDAAGAAKDEGPFLTGDRTRRVPKGYETTFQFGEESHTFAYSHITYNEGSLQIEAVPGGKVVEFMEQDTLYFYWEAGDPKPASWEKLAGIIQEFDEESITAVTLKGQDWSANSAKLSIGKVTSDAVEIAFEGTYQKVKGETTVQVKGTIRAYQGVWNE
jgi:hypothetical protein